MPHLLKKLLPSGYIESDTTRYRLLLQHIRKREVALQPLSDSGLRKRCARLEEEINNLTPEEQLIEAYALASEAAARILKMRPYNVQIIAAIALNEGKVIEMATGEGKTLVATMPAYLNALLKNNVHIHTFNDYLARRDAEWMKPLYHFLGLTVGCIQEKQNNQQRKEIYKNQLVYLTAKEGGFDFLKNFLATTTDEIIQEKRNFAIIDEVDSLLIDEARVPLVIAGEEQDQLHISFKEITKIVCKLQQQVHFQTDEYALNIFLTDLGLTEVERLLNCKNLYAPENEELLVKVNLSLQAHYLLHRDTDYIVRNDQIELVDEFTGRVMDNRKWPHGLQAAIEAKEGLEVQPEGKILGKTTLQHFFRTYDKLSGMTGTARAAAEEFAEFYHMPVFVVPPNRPNMRVDYEDLIFPDRQSKYKAIAEEIEKAHQTGRPVLVGTATIEESEHLAGLLISRDINVQVLNAKNDEEEAKIIARAGKLGAVTISTNMAGRGTDIKLGGEEGECREEILELGGLYVIGTNRFESRRIDDQLRGRAGRQGDPGASRFFISLEDNLLKKHGIDELIPRRFREATTTPEINNSIIRREVNRTQRIVEGKNFDIKKTLWQYASFVEVQRSIILEKRQDIVLGEWTGLWENSADYKVLMQKYGAQTVKKAEQQMALAIIDKHWADYLEEADRIRLGIHLVAIGGLNPFREFQKQLTELFEKLLADIDREIIDRMNTVTITPDGVDLGKEGLQRPGSTWTYLVNDNPFGDKLESMLKSSSDIGFAAGAALQIPLLAAYFIVKKLFAKKREPGDSNRQQAESVGKSLNQ
ncbi:Protein export cytoplasm protein SecA ATPase RNA helicase [Fulvivirga imtechensis AK7]|uniref:Protein translocase subunit SecA n=1 Tax=Fulvivirga imtechensis AK7 TaxID=1237149 RepID=L8JRA0_9BACT|nr:accessory Sec system translocase SecA2 [Fulvivirga imtechensis]ELR69872.1 Protein export cytoplasm protein SecA ATPase RNA helicase [Fulvivirga imtechensis AK7]